MKTKQIIFIIILLLTVIAFLLRVLPFGYGTSITFSDTQLFSQALNLGNAVAEHNLSQFKTPNFYPYFFSYVFLFFFGIFYLIGLIGGLFSSSAEFIKYIILQMDQLFEASRIIISILGALIVPLVYLITRRLISEKIKYKENIWAIAGSVLATIFITFSLLHVHYAKLLRAHIPVSFFFLLTFYFYLILLKKNNFLSYIALGLASGATAGVLQNGFISILFLVLGHFFLTYQKTKKEKIFNKLKGFFSWKFIVSLVVFLLIIVISYPYVFFSPENALNLKAGKFNLTLSGNKIVNHGDDLTSFQGGGFITELKGLFFYELGLMIILVFLLAVYFIAYRKKTKTIASKSWYYTSGILGLMFFIIFYFILFGIYDHTRYRMLIPLIPFLCIIIGVLAFLILNRVSKKYKYWIIGFIVLILIFPITQSLRLTSLATKDSTQDLALKWIKTNINPDEMIALESHSRIKLTPSRESLKKHIDLFGPNSIGQRNEFLLSFDKEAYPKDAMTMLHLYLFKENYNELYEFLETEADYLVLGRYAIEPGIAPSKDYVYQINLSLDKELVQKFIPFKKEDSKRISAFPIEIENPIIDLWAYERMGSVIEIYKINR